jgi:hypothetical protein
MVLLCPRLPLCPTSGRVSLVRGGQAPSARQPAMLTVGRVENPGEVPTFPGGFPMSRTEATLARIFSTWRENRILTGEVLELVLILRGPRLVFRTLTAIATLRDCLWTTLTTASPDGVRASQATRIVEALVSQKTPLTHTASFHPLQDSSHQACSLASLLLWNTSLQTLVQHSHLTRRYNLECVGFQSGSSPSVYTSTPTL